MSLGLGLNQKKRKKSERVYRLKKFGEYGYPVEFDGSFRENVKALLEYGNLESDFKSWSFQLEVQRHPPFHIVLVVVEDPVQVSVDLHCKHCQYVGWGEHMVCNKKYHFVIPSKETMEGSGGGDPTKGYSSLIGIQGHLLHGVIHLNGFGHLLSVNGVEAGSDLTGYLIMDFWDRLCTGLRARKVSLNDISNKKSMELRLLYGVAYGATWFSRWGYRFEHGTYGITQQTYLKAIEAIQNMPLCLLTNHLTHFNHEFSLVFSRYLALPENTTIPSTLGDLLRLMFELKTHLPRENSMLCNPGILVDSTNCRWSMKRVEMAIRVIVESLRRAENRWISRQEVRDASRVYIGDTGLLDFVLKSLGNQIVGKYFVRRSLNPVTKVLEYCLQDISSVLPNSQEVLVTNNSNGKVGYKITRAQLNKDMFYLYKYILKDQTGTLNTGIFNAIQVAVRIILDAKYLVKEYQGETPWKTELLEGKLNLFCTIALKNEEEFDRRTIQPIPPYECVTLKNNATFHELSIEVEKTFKEIYWGLSSFAVESIANLNAKEKDLVFGLVEVGRKLVFEGRNKDKNMMVLYENGLINKAVECCCGAKDDDGERMVCCDICEVWQHTRCVCIPNNQEVPHIFICTRCEQHIIPLSSLP